MASTKKVSLEEGNEALPSTAAPGRIWMVVWGSVHSLHTLAGAGTTLKSLPRTRSEQPLLRARTTTCAS